MTSSEDREDSGCDEPGLGQIGRKWSRPSIDPPLHHPPHLMESSTALHRSRVDCASAVSSVANVTKLDNPYIHLIFPFD